MHHVIGSLNYGVGKVGLGETLQRLWRKGERKVNYSEDVDEERRPAKGQVIFMTLIEQSREDTSKEGTLEGEET